MKRKAELANELKDLKNESGSNKFVDKGTELVLTVSEIVGMTLECLLVLDQVHDFGEKDERNLLYEEKKESDTESVSNNNENVSDSECQLYLKYARKLLDKHWKRIQTKYESLKSEPIYNYLFHGVSLERIVTQKSYKYKVCKTIVEIHHKIMGKSLLPNEMCGDVESSVYSNWRAEDLVKRFEKFLKKNKVEKLYIDYSRSKYNMYPLLHTICNNSFDTEPNNNFNLRIIKTIATVYDPSISNFIESYVNKIQELHGNNKVEIENHYSLFEQRYKILTETGKTIIDFSFKRDKHFHRFHLFKTPISYLTVYNHKAKCAIQRVFKQEFPQWFNVGQKLFCQNPIPYIIDLKSKMVSVDEVPIVALNQYRVRAKIHQFLDEKESDIKWSKDDEPFKNVSVRNVSDFVKRNGNSIENIENTFAYKTIGDLSQILECVRGGGLFITADDICGYIASLLVPTLFEPETGHVLSPLLFYNKSENDLKVKKQKL